MVGRESELHRSSGRHWTTSPCCTGRCGHRRGPARSRAWARPVSWTEVLAGAADFRVLTAECGHSGATAPYATVRLLLAAALGFGATRRPLRESPQGRLRLVEVSDPQLVGQLPTPARPGVRRAVGRAPQQPMSSPWARHPLRPAAASGDRPRCPASSRRGADLGEEFRSDALHRLVLAVLEAALFQGPTLLVVEDAHLMDGDSARVLAQLTARCRRPAPGCCSTTRRGARRRPAPPGPTWWWSSGRWRSTRPAHDRAHDPGPPAATRAAEALARRAGGIRCSSASWSSRRREARPRRPPGSVEQLVAVRSTRCPPRSALLRRAAVLGNSFPLRLLCWMLDRHDAGTEVEQLSARSHAGRSPVAGRWPARFRHAVHREMAYAGLPCAPAGRCTCGRRSPRQCPGPVRGAGPRSSPCTTSRAAVSAGLAVRPQGRGAGASVSPPRPRPSVRPGRGGCVALARRTRRSGPATWRRWVTRSSCAAVRTRPTSPTRSPAGSSTPSPLRARAVAQARQGRPAPGSVPAGVPHADLGLQASTGGDPRLW